MEDPEIKDLLLECRDMLREITAYIRKRESLEYKEQEDMKDFAINVAADLYSEILEEEAKKNIRSCFNKQANVNQTK